MPFTSTALVEIDQNRKVIVETRNLGTGSTDILFSEILDPVNIYYSGSIIVIREFIQVLWEITDPSLISVDKTWPFDRYYLGSWQVFDANYNPVSNSDSYGFCNYIETKVTFDSYAVVTADPGNLSTFGPIGKSQTCNFTLIPVQVSLPGGAVTGYTTNGVEPLFQNFTQEAPPTVFDSIFARKIYAFGVYANPGAEPRSITYTIADINQIPVSGTAFEQFSCSITLSCDAEFAAYVDLVNGGRPIDDPLGVVFNTNASCQAANPSGQGCALNQYICNDGGVRNYYVPIQT